MLLNLNKKITIQSSDCTLYLRYFFNVVALSLRPSAEDSIPIPSHQVAKKNINFQMLLMQKPFPSLSQPQKHRCYKQSSKSENITDAINRYTWAIAKIINFDILHYLLLHPHYLL